MCMRDCTCERREIFRSLSYKGAVTVTETKFLGQIKYVIEGPTESTGNIMLSTFTEGQAISLAMARLRACMAEGG